MKEKMIGVGTIGGIHLRLSRFNELLALEAWEPLDHGAWAYYLIKDLGIYHTEWSHPHDQTDLRGAVPTE